MIGEAGFEKTQDCKVIIVIKDSGGINVVYNSKLQKMFGEQTKHSVKAELESLDVYHADVTVNDCGSLDFVIRARVKTAVDRARGNHHG